MGWAFFKRVFLKPSGLGFLKKTGFLNPEYCSVIVVEPGVLLVNPIRPCLKINDHPVGWEHFSQLGWDVFEVPAPVTIDGLFCTVL